VSPRFLLDTSTISEPMKKAPDEAMVAKIEAHAHQCVLAAPVWHELRYGCRLLPSGKRRTALEAYLREVVYTSFPILPYDATAHQSFSCSRCSYLLQQVALLKERVNQFEQSS
jgi:tRNA(fMet)-specific endonuclease VapC